MRMPRSLAFLVVAALSLAPALFAASAFAAGPNDAIARSTDGSRLLADIVKEMVVSGAIVFLVIAGLAVVAALIFMPSARSSDAVTPYTGARFPVWREPPS